MYSKVVDKKFVVQSTTAQEYESAPDGYDALLSDDVRDALIAEKADKDKVEGTESLYLSLTNLCLSPNVDSSIEGTEGFIQNIKSGLDKLWQWLKNLLEYLKNVIFSRKKRVERQLSDLSVLVKTGTVKKRAGYPASIIPLHPLGKSMRMGEVPTNLEWIKTEQENIKAYIENSKTILVNAKAGLTRWEAAFDEVVKGRSLEESGLSDLPTEIELLFRPLRLAPTNLNNTGFYDVEGTVFGSYQVYVSCNGLYAPRFEIFKGNRYTGKQEFSTVISTIQTIYNTNDAIGTKLTSFYQSSESSVKSMIKSLERAIARVPMSQRSDPIKQAARFINFYIAIVSRFINSVNIDVLKVQENINKTLLAAF